MNSNDEEIDYEQLLNDTSTPQIEIIQSINSSNTHKSEIKKPHLTPNIIEQSYKRKEYFKSIKDNHHQKVLQEEEKIYGKVLTFESKSFKKLKQLEREGKRYQPYSQSNQYNQSHQMKQFTLTPQQLDDIQKKNEHRQLQYQQQYKQMLKDREKQSQQKQDADNELMKSKVTQQQIDDARKRYFERISKK